MRVGPSIGLRRSPVVNVIDLYVTERESRSNSISWRDDVDGHFFFLSFAFNSRLSIFSPFPLSRCCVESSSDRYLFLNIYYTFHVSGSTTTPPYPVLPLFFHFVVRLVFCCCYTRRLGPGPPGCARVHCTENNLTGPAVDSRWRNGMLTCLSVRVRPQRVPLA